jgi:hypothetical protein
LGTFSIRHLPLTSSAAGKIATAAFFAPLMVTVPFRGKPPLITYRAKDNPLLAKIGFITHFEYYTTL